MSGRRAMPARVLSGLETQSFPWRQVQEDGDTVVADDRATPAVGGAATGTPPPRTRDPLPDFEATLTEASARAREIGRQEGLAQGRGQGEQRARSELTPLHERLARTIADLSGTRDAFRHEAEEDVVRLALGVAKRILHRELSIDPEALTGVIHVALGKFDARELHRVLVSTEDHAVISAAVQGLRLPRRVEVVADPTLERGAALFETVKGTLDASVDTQLDEIERGFLDVLGKEGRRG